MIAPERRIKVMADYFCHPLWHIGGVDVGDIDHATLQISNDLQSNLDAWAGAFDAILDMDDPANKGGFESPQAAESFIAQGAQFMEAGILHVGMTLFLGVDA